MLEIANTLNGLIWSTALIILCVGAGIYFSIITGFLQVRYLRDMLHYLFTDSSSPKGVSSFQSFSIALSGRVGTGNITGVATAITMGGPGAVFWMWAIAFLGAASAFIEATLGQIYKTYEDGQYRGGPAYYIEKGLGLKWYAVLFAIVTVFSTAFFLPGVQSNSMAASMNNAFGVPVEYSGLGVTLLLAVVIVGGVRRIGKVAELIVPFMAGGYLLMAIIIIVINYQSIPDVFGLIFRSAFGAEQAMSGIIGSAIAWGVKRGIYSNEAGQGTAPHAAAAAEVSHPAKQGLVQAFSVYVDTLLICTATAFIILFTGQYNVVNPEGGYLVENVPGLEMGTASTQAAVNKHFPALGNGFVAIALLFFVYTTIMAYYYIAETNLAYLIKNRSGKNLIWVLRALILFSTFYGSIKTAELAWALGDIGVGMMAWLNLIAIFFLRKPAMKVWRDYQEQRKTTSNPIFDPKKLGIPHTETWEDTHAEQRTS